MCLKLNYAILLIHVHVQCSSSVKYSNETSAFDGTTEGNWIISLSLHILSLDNSVMREDEQFHFIKENYKLNDSPIIYKVSDFITKILYYKYQIKQMAIKLCL